MPRNANDFVYEFLKNSTSVEMGTVAGTFSYTVPASKTFQLSRMNFSMVDGAMQYGKFGGMTALTNGIKVEVIDSTGGTLIDFTGGVPLKSNEDFACLAGVDAIAEPTAGDDFMPVRFTIAKAGDEMRLSEGNVIQVVTQDDLSALSHFRCMVQGINKE